MSAGSLWTGGSTSQWVCQPVGTPTGGSEIWRRFTYSGYPSVDLSVDPARQASGWSPIHIHRFTDRHRLAKQAADHPPMASHSPGSRSRRLVTRSSSELGYSLHLRHGTSCWQFHLPLTNPCYVIFHDLCMFMYERNTIARIIGYWFFHVFIFYWSTYQANFPFVWGEITPMARGSFQWWTLNFLSNPRSLRD